MNQDLLISTAPQIVKSLQLRTASRGGVALLAAAISTQGLAQPPDTKTDAPDAAEMPVDAQQSPTPAPEIDPTTGEPFESEEIVVKGQKPRGSVLGDISPEFVLDARDMRALGANSIDELIQSIASQIGGRPDEQPIVLLNGKRIAGLEEIGAIPPEAIERMDILPPEVAAKYGYQTSQRVLNIVLFKRFASTDAKLNGGVATDGGFAQAGSDATRVMIGEHQRTTINMSLSGNSALFESERDIALQPVAPETDNVDPRPFRTLRDRQQNAKLSLVANRTIFDDVSATLNVGLNRSANGGQIGVATGELDHGGSAIVRAFAGEGLDRETTTTALHVGTSVNGQLGKWRWSSTANLDLSNGKTETERGFDLAPAQARLDAGEPGFDPLGELGPLPSLGDNLNISKRRSLGADATLYGSLLELPAGKVTTTFKLGQAIFSSQGISRLAGVVTPFDDSRAVTSGSASVDVPITNPDAPIGRLHLVGNAGFQRQSAMGTTASIGATANWQPRARLQVSASFRRSENAISGQLLEGQLVETPGVPYFDFLTGETVFVTAVTGGNPDLKSGSTKSFNVRSDWRPFEKANLSLRAEYSQQVTDNSLGSLPAASAALETAFPERFQRDPDGTLVRVDLRPINFESARQSSLRWGLTIFAPLKSKRTQRQIESSLSKMRFVPAPGDSQTIERIEVTPNPNNPPSGRPSFPPGEMGARLRNAAMSGRLSLSFSHQLQLVDKATIRGGLPKLDYLEGDAATGSGGRPRHSLQLEAGYFGDGAGVRLEGEWRSATKVGDGDQRLEFSPYAKFDLKAFANIAQRFPNFAKDHPFFIGSSIRLEFDNLFNSRPRVRDVNGLTPLGYQPDLLEPLGRTVGITFRKLFLPGRPPRHMP